MNLNKLAGTMKNTGFAMGGRGQFASPIGQDRLIRKEVSLGLIREIVPPETHIGLSLFPFLDVPTDDVIFNYAMGMVDGLAPARAEDAESELAQKDDIFQNEGRASVIDWAIKDHYSASDISRYREWLAIQEQVRDTLTVPLTVNSMTADWQSKLTRDAARRRRKLDNRIEWMIMSAMSTGSLAYNDGKIKFTVDWGRPSVQQITFSAANINGDTKYPIGDAWSATTSDPIRDITSVQEYIYDTYGVRITRAITSRRVLNSILNSDRFAARTGLVVGGTPVSSPIDPRYLIDGWGPTAAMAIVEQQTGLTFQEYDSVYRTRAIGSTTTVNNRFLPENRIVFLPDPADVAEFDDTDLGMGRVLTSPHPAGNWSSGFYEWEREYGVDPWGYDVGTGIKAFPVFPHMQLTFALDVLA